MYLQNKQEEKLKGKNYYTNKEFFIEYLFVSNLKSFKEARIKIDFEEFNAYVNNVIKNFESTTKINPFDLIKKLKWLS